LRDGFLLLTAMFFHGLSLGNLGVMSEALATLEGAIRIATRNGDAFWRPRMPNCIGWLHRELQDFASALKYDQEGLEVSRQYQVLEAEANSLINLGIDHTHAHRPAETVSAFHEARDIFDRDAWFRWRYMIRLEAASADYWLREGDLTKAGEFVERLLDRATKYGCHKYIAEAHKLKARIAMNAGDRMNATKSLEDALTELRSHPAPLVAWKTYAELGRLQSSAGDLTAAREAFGRAAEIVNKCAANVANPTLRETFLGSEAVREVLSGAN